MSHRLISHLDGRQRSKAAILAKLARDLHFPRHFGHNLDALEDVLTRDIEGPLRIVWRRNPKVLAAIGPEAERIERVLRSAAAERGDMTLDIRD